MDWKDVTTYSRDDKERIPKSFELKLPNIRICVTKGHIYYPDKWVMHCFNIKIDSKPLNAKDLESAKKESIDIVAELLNDMLNDIKLVVM